MTGPDVRCPLCTDELCVCRSEQLSLGDALDDEHVLGVGGVSADGDDFEAVAGPAGDPVAGPPDVGGRPVRAEVVAVEVDERKGGHVWTLRAVPDATTAVAWSLTGGPCAGWYPAVSTWPPPDTIRAVVNAAGVTAVLDLPGDEPEQDETVEVYRRAGLAHMCGRGGCQLVASYYPAGFTEKEKMVAARAAAGLSGAIAAAG